MNKILVMNINWLGDAIFSTPVFKALKESFPHAHITCCCPPRVKDVMMLCPYVDKVLIYDERRKHRWPWQKLKFILKLRQESFDAAVLLHRSATRALLVFLAGIKHRVGYSKASWLLTAPVAYPSKDLHRSDVYLNVLSGFKITPPISVCQLNLDLRDIDAVELLLRKYQLLEGKYVVFHPAGNWDLKRWPADYWAQLALAITNKWQLPIVITGVKEDHDLINSIMLKAAKANIISFVGQTRLGESLVVYQKAAAVISGDSGPLHLAHSVGANILGLYGPTRLELTGPRGIGEKRTLFHDIGCNKASCYLLSCSSNTCMQSINVEEVCRELSAFIK